MRRSQRSRRPSHPASRTRRKSRTAPAPPSVTVAAPPAPIAIVRPTPRVAALPEAPHTHLVCRACARILEVPMQFDQQQALEELLLRTPSGWTVDSITVSLTGACPRCREGPVA